MELNDAVRKCSVRDKWLSSLLDNMGNISINAEIVDELIAEIRVVDKKSMEVVFKFEDIFSINVEDKAV